MPEEHAGPDGSDTQLVRKLATILSADVAEYSRLMGEDEEGTLRTFRGHKQVFESLVALHRGRIFNTAGDAILAEFSSAVEAVRCATDIQSALRTRNDQLPANRQVRFRIGINLGDVMVQGQDLMGDGVNVAARIQTAAEPGGVCISGSVHDQIVNKLSLSFLPLGERSFKNIQQPVRTFSISEAEGSGALPSPKVPPPKGMSSGVKRAMAGAVLLVLGGGYYAYTVSQRSAHESGNNMASATPTPPPQVAAAPASAPAAASSTRSPAASVDTPASSSASSPAPPPSPAAKSGAVAPAAALAPALVGGAPAPHAIPPHQPAAAASSAAVAASFDGTYSGPICFAETPREPSRCFRQNGVISGRKISAQWMMGREKKVAMVLAGNVEDSGRVTIDMEMHSGTYDGERIASIEVIGTITGGIIDAKGSFRNGRGATLLWHKD
jgi:class 3 adenylate cyclase